MTTKERVVREVLLGVERVPQPVPSRNAGGDCFACALCAGLRWLYKQEIPLGECWEYFLNPSRYYGPDEVFLSLRDTAAAYLAGEATREALAEAVEAAPARKEPLLSNTWPQFRDALYSASARYGRLEITNDTVQPLAEELRQWSYPWPERCAQEYARRLEGWFATGWVAWTEIDLDGKGPTTGIGEDGRIGRNTINHFVALDGVRRVYRQFFNPDGSFHHGSWDYQVHMIDSSTRNATGWHEVGNFIRRHGAGAWWLARREEG